MAERNEFQATTGADWSGTNPSKTYDMTALIIAGWTVKEDSVQVIAGRTNLIPGTDFSFSSPTITLAVAISDDDFLGIAFVLDDGSSTTLSSISDVRNTLLISDEDFLTDDRISLALVDANSQLPSFASNNAKAERYLACWLLAKRFKMQYVSRSGDRSYSEVDPSVYETMYSDYLKSLRSNRSKKINIDNVMVDNGVQY